MSHTSHLVSDNGRVEPGIIWLQELFKLLFKLCSLPQCHTASRPITSVRNKNQWIVLALWLAPELIYTGGGAGGVMGKLQLEK